jgi:hypothetical protein
MGQLVSQSLDTIDTALEYLDARFKEIVDRMTLSPETNVIFVLDNIQGICPRAEE